MRGLAAQSWSYRPFWGGSNLGRCSPSCEALPLALGSPQTATIAPLAATFYSVSSDVGGKLTVSLDAPGFAARLSLVDAARPAAGPERRPGNRRR